MTEHGSCKWLIQSQRLAPGLPRMKHGVLATARQSHMEKSIAQ